MSSEEVVITQESKENSAPSTLNEISSQIESQLSMKLPANAESSTESKKPGEKSNDPEEENFLVAKKPASKEVIIIGSQQNTDLQASFKKFREQKLKERQIMKLCQQIDSTNQQRSEDFRNGLRNKFLEKAKSYLGVPYARRFEDPSKPEAPLYLDCCALVRQCVQDLSNEFGFIIGRWNQAYQMDTLPIVLDDISKCKPGDLIFYEGIYTSKRSKPQKHNNVHVEIFWGGETGEATIASRYHKGQVSIFPSYKFTSTTWTLVKHHFRSLDTWLNGVCKSCCPEHAWQSDALAYLEAAGKRSIFSDEHETEKERRKKILEEMEDDVRADGDVDDDENPHEEEGEQPDSTPNGDIDEENDNIGGGDDEEEPLNQCSPKLSTFEPISSSLSPSGRNKSYSVNDADEFALPDVKLFSKQTSNSTSKLEIQGDSLDVLNRSFEKKLSSPVKGPGTAAVSTHNAPVVGNSMSGKMAPKNRRVLSKSLDNQEQIKIGNESVSSRRLAGNNNEENQEKNASRSTKAIPKRVSKYSSTNYNSDGGENISLNASLSSSSSQKLVPGISSSGKAPGTMNETNSIRSSQSKEDFKNIPANRTYYVSKSNGWKLVKMALDKRGWIQLPFEYQFTSRFGLKWVERRSQIDYRAHQNGQLVCHIPNNDIITTKIGILTVLRDKFCAKSLPASQRMISPPWVPLTFDIESPTDMNHLFEIFDNNPKEANEMIWIYKPSCNNRGRGIKVVSGRSDLELICHGNKQGDIEPLKGIVQKYIENPLLIQPDGFKFDIRCYLLIARNSPTTFAFYHPGYCRLALKPYNKSDLNDTFMHLTNASVQKKGEVYQNNKDIQIQSLTEVADKMEIHGKLSSANYIRNQLDHEIKLCMVDVMKACNGKLMRKHGYFDLLGCDFMVTDDNKLYLLEINTNPALSLDNKVLEDLLPNVVDGALDLVIQTQGSDVTDLSSVSIHPNDVLPAQYHLIFDEKNNWFYT